MDIYVLSHLYPFSIITGVFKTVFVIKTQRNTVVSAPVLTACLKVSSPQRSLFFFQTLEEARLSGTFITCKRIIHTGLLGDRTQLKPDSMLFSRYLYMWQVGASSAGGVWAEGRPEINFSPADWCLLPSKRLSGSLELLCWVPDERDVTQRLFLNMMELSSISISSSVYLMRQWDKEIPECGSGGL